MINETEIQREAATIMADSEMNQSDGNTSDALVQHRIAEAVACVRCGWSLVPLNGKKPTLKNWTELPATTEEQARDYARRGNFGIRTGAISGIVVLDIDPRHGGVESLATLKLPKTPTVRTGSGGKHFYFSYPKGGLKNSVEKLAPGIDIRGDGGQVVAPPSIHPETGQPYQWELSPDDCSLAALPETIIEKLRRGSPEHDAPSGVHDRIPEGQRNSELTSLAGSMRRRGMSQEAIYAALGIENQKRCNPPLNDDEIHDIALSVSRYQPTRDRQTIIATEASWPMLAEEAYHSLIGEFVRAVEPYSEADPVAILIHALAGSACLIGSGPQFMVEHSPHFARINTLFVGRTAGGRKGTAWSTPRYVLSQIDEGWTKKRVKSGLSSGEGLIYQVRDPQYEKKPIREAGKRTGAILGYEDVMTDEGEVDKRLLIIESEFASTLKMLEREGNTLSPISRDAWDHGNLSPLTKNDRIKATGAHISIIGHVTRDELLRYLTATERGNGFANRFLFAMVQRSKFIPSGQGTPQKVLEPYFTRFSHTVEKARTRGKMVRDPEAEALWAGVYPKLCEEVPGLTGAILARAEAQVLRLSMIYSLLDEKETEAENPAIRPCHLLAALAVWGYCKESVRYIFGDAIGDPIADRLLRAIKTGPQTDTALYEALGKHDGGRKDPALDLLVRLNQVHVVSKPTTGRPIREWHLGTAQGCVFCV